VTLDAAIHWNQGSFVHKILCLILPEFCYTTCTCPMLSFYVQYRVCVLSFRVETRSANDIVAISFSRSGRCCPWLTSCHLREQVTHFRSPWGSDIVWKMTRRLKCRRIYQCATSQFDDIYLIVPTQHTYGAIIYCSRDVDAHGQTSAPQSRCDTKDERVYDPMIG
jgi:hypothetical protein